MIKNQKGRKATLKNANPVLRFDDFSALLDIIDITLYKFDVRCDNLTHLHIVK